MTVIDQLRIGDAQHVLLIPGLPVQTERFELAMSGHDQRPAGCFVNAARLHADDPILDDIHAADAVRPADLVQILEKLHRRNSHDRSDRRARPVRNRW